MPENIFTIPPESEFAPALARGLMARAVDKEGTFDPLRLSEMLVLLPTRRAARHVRDAFLALTPAALLPRMQPLGDEDEDELLITGTDTTEIPPAISPLRRQMLLTQLVLRRDASMSFDQAYLQATALARLLDEAHINQRDLRELPQLVQDRDLATHWQETVRFLSIITDVWPNILREEGCIDIGARRNLVLAAQVERWKQNLPAYPVIAAGSTGSIPATADVLVAVTGLPQGMLILPGLDQQLDNTAWEAVGDSHPQFGMKELLQRLKMPRDKVSLWCDASLPAHRTRLLQESMRPAEVTEAWRELTPAQIPADALHNLSRIDVDHAEEEAQVVALLLRHALEAPNKTAALITLDRALAERVAAHLLRWDIMVDDSSGAPLAVQPAGGYLTTLLAAVAPNASTVETLAFLKHPITACGIAPAQCRAAARNIEINFMRAREFDGEPLPAPEFLQKLNGIFADMRRTWTSPLPLRERITAHIVLAEKLAASDSATGAARLWKDEAGEKVAEFLNDWQQAANDFPPLSGDDYAALLAELLRAAAFRPSRGRHPRLSILGPLEARLTRADFAVLGGLNEGVWPPEAIIDPWMSRPMKTAFGLPLPERRVGLSAHDFVQLAAGGDVVITRARRRGGAPTVPSRFLSQMDVVLQALGHKDALRPGQPWVEWARMMDVPEVLVQIAPPAPCPPAHLRPTTVSVTRVGEWMRNPYAIYARYVLDLRLLEDLDDEVDAALRGTMIHRAFEKFITAHMSQLPDTSLLDLLEIGRGIFDRYEAHPKVRAFWWPRFENVAAWFVAHERVRRANGIIPLAVEAKGEMHIGNVKLTGIVDRIDRLPHGALEIIDYKTASVPTEKDVKAGIEPQLALLALIAQNNGFPAIKNSRAESLSYWKIAGNDGEEKTMGDAAETAQRVEEAEAGLRALLDAFADVATPFRAVPRPSLAPRYDDYAHLARLAEWGRMRGDE